MIALVFEDGRHEGDSAQDGMNQHFDETLCRLLAHERLAKIKGGGVSRSPAHATLLRMRFSVSVAESPLRPGSFALQCGLISLRQQRGGKAPNSSRVE